jgi:hypothetical protein
VRPVTRCFWFLAEGAVGLGSPFLDASAAREARRTVTSARRVRHEAAAGIVALEAYLDTIDH